VSLDDIADDDDDDAEVLASRPMSFRVRELALLNVSTQRDSVLGDKYWRCEVLQKRWQSALLLYWAFLIEPYETLESELDTCHVL
jgi:hypothetical protein